MHKARRPGIDGRRLLLRIWIDETSYTRKWFKINIY